MLDSKWGQIGGLPHTASYHGTAGTLLVGRGELELYSTVATPEAVRGWTRLPVPEGYARHQPGGEQHTFVEHVRSGKPLAEGGASPRVARQTQEVIEAVYASARQGRAVHLPLPGA